MGTSQWASIEGGSKWKNLYRIFKKHKPVVADFFRAFSCLWFASTDLRVRRCGCCRSAQITACLNYGNK